MVVTDPSIDPITGLPVLNPSGPVQQIPLGQEVFPYADLNATAQPTRGPIYGDDIIPTSSLITAPDKQLKPRSIQATTSRELRVREAVFQNLGAAIPDGTTAPVDVNVVSGGGGGGGGISPNYSGPFTNQIEFSTGEDYFFDRTCAATDLLYQVRVSCELDVTNSGSPPDKDYALIWFFLATATPVPVFNLGSLHLVWNGSTGGSTTCGVYEATFPLGLSIADMGFVAGNDVRLYYQTVRNAPWRLSAHWMWKL